MSSSEQNQDERTGLIIMTDDECVELLESTPIGRVVFITDGHPVALPVNYRWFENSVVFRALDGSKLHAAAQESPVGFEVDRWDEHSRAGASVLIKGTATEVTDWAEKAQLEELNVVPWAGGPWRQAWVRIAADQVTGRRLG